MFPVENISFKKIGPVQFWIGICLNKVRRLTIRIHVLFQPKEKQNLELLRKIDIKIFTYTISWFSQSNTAKQTKLTEDDVRKMMYGIWYGTNNLSTTSRVWTAMNFFYAFNLQDENDYIGM